MLSNLITADSAHSHEEAGTSFRIQYKGLPLTLPSINLVNGIMTGASPLLPHPLISLPLISLMEQRQGLTSDSPCVSLDEFLEWYAHLLLHSARSVDMAADTEQLGAMVTLSPKRGKPVTSATTNGLGGGREARQAAHEINVHFVALDLKSKGV